MKTKLRKGDRVIVIAGKDNGKEGNITFIDRKHGRVLVDGVNQGFKHQKPNAMGQGGRVEKEFPIHISNVAYSLNGAPARLGVEIKDDKKVRVAITKNGRTVID